MQPSACCGSGLQFVSQFWRAAPAGECEHGFRPRRIGPRRSLPKITLRPHSRKRHTLIGRRLLRLFPAGPGASSVNSLLMSALRLPVGRRCQGYCLPPNRRYHFDKVTVTNCRRYCGACLTEWGNAPARLRSRLSNSSGISATVSEPRPFPSHLRFRATTVSEPRPSGSGFAQNPKNCQAPLHASGTGCVILF